MVIQEGLDSTPEILDRKPRYGGWKLDTFSGSSKLNSTKKK